MRQRYTYQPRSGHGLPHDPLNAIVGPRPIDWVSSQSASGQRNLAPYSFFGNCQQIGRHGDRFALRIGLRHHAPVVRRAQHQRIIGAGVQLNLNLTRRVGELITAGRRAPAASNAG